MSEFEQEALSWLADVRRKVALAKAVGVALLDGRAEERFVSLLTALDAALVAADALLDASSSKRPIAEGLDEEELPPR